MSEFEAVVKTIKRDEFKTKLSEESQFEKYAKNKRRNSVDFGSIAVAYIRYCRQCKCSSPELKIYLLKFMELEELMDRFYSRMYYNLDVECKIAKYITANREELVSFTDWIEDMITEQNSNPEYSYT